MIEKWDITIPELTGDETRRAYLYLPDSYDGDPDTRYPVLYMFDGHNLFFDEDATYGKSWGIKDYMDFTGTQLIIAAVECNHSPDHGRLKEYSPFTFRDPGFGVIPGMGRITMEWFVNTFKPYIDENYPTIPDREFTYIAGSSMGGLMSLYAVLEYNHVFSRAAALSPSLWVAPDRIASLIRRADIAPDTVIYMDYGSNELSNHRKMTQLYRKTVSQLLERNIYLTSRIVPEGEHCEACWEKQLPIFMETLIYDPYIYQEDVSGEDCDDMQEYHDDPDSDIMDR